jgi:hypothetical protein
MIDSFGCSGWTFNDRFDTEAQKLRLSFVIQKIKLVVYLGHFVGSRADFLE